MYNDLIANSCQSFLNSYFSFGSYFLHSSLTLIYKEIRQNIKIFELFCHQSFRLTHWFPFILTVLGGTLFFPPKSLLFRSETNL